MFDSDFDPSKPYKYIRYGRMSDPGQNPRSPDQQLITVDETLLRCCYSWIHLEIDFRDDGISGRYQRKRPGFCKMLTAIRTGAIKPDLILVDTLERFGRMEELEAIQRELRNKYGVLILTADTDFADPSSEAGRAARMVKNFQAVAEGRTKAHNVVRGKRDAARRGRWPGGPAPIGLRLRSIMKSGEGPQEVDYRVPEHDPESAGLVQEEFRLAHEEGWGTSRISKHLNKQPELVKKFGHFNAATIGRILDNPIYIGRMVWGRVSTDVIDDRRVSRRNPEERVLVVEDFCEPLVPREVWDAVQRVRRERGRRIKQARQMRSDTPEKHLRPVAPGIILKYPLTGLVRCGECGASMRPTSSGTKSAAGRRYVYYNCPLHVSGSCPNGVYLPEDWLRSRVIAALRRRLFPPPADQDSDADQPSQVPLWFAELMDEVQVEWQRLCSADQDQRPLLQRELEDIKSRVDGWLLSLSNRELLPQTRQLVEQQVGDAMIRTTLIEQELAALRNAERCLVEALDPQAVVEALHRLDEVLASGSPTSINAELSLHIDHIAVHRDGRVAMYTCRLGALEGLTELLSRPRSDAEPRPDASDGGTVVRVKPRRRPKLFLSVSSDEALLSGPSGIDRQDPQRFAGLAANWFWEDSFQYPGKRCWAKEHATEVLRGRKQEKLTLRELAERFGKSIPTIRHALRIAEQQAGQ